MLEFYMERGLCHMFTGDRAYMYRGWGLCVYRGERLVVQGTYPSTGDGACVCTGERG